MIPDPKLVEAVARAHYESYGGNWDVLPEGVKAMDRQRATAVLAAIAASREWWIAPWEASDEMDRAAGPYSAETEPEQAKAMFRAMRTAHLKDTGTDK